MMEADIPALRHASSSCLMQCKCVMLFEEVVASLLAER